MEIDAYYLAILSIPILLIFLGVGVPIFVSLGTIGILGVMLSDGVQNGLGLLREGTFPALSTYEFVVVPLFVLMGHLAYEAGVTANAFDIGRKLLSRLPGGLALATTLASAAFGAACGSSVAASATIGKIAIPEMEAAGYDRKLACASVAAGGLLAIMIPPSIILVLYAIFTDNSVGACLLAGFFPGLLSTIVFMLGISFLVWRNPQIAPPSISFPWRERIKALSGGWQFILLFVVVIGGIYGGLYTPSEAAASGALVALILLITSRGNDKLKKVKSAFFDAAQTSVFILIIILCAGYYSYFLLTAGAPNTITEFVKTLDLPPIIILLICLSIYIPLGCFLDPTSCLLITLPLIYPLLIKELGFNPIWFGVLVTKMIEIGLLTPPVGLNVFTVAGVAPHVPIEEIFKGVSWFIVFEIISLALIVLIPSISTWLPTIMLYSGK